MEKIDIYNSHYSSLLGFAITKVKDKADAYDVLQKVYIYFNNKDLNSFNDEEHIKRWLMWLTNNECIVYYRANNKRYVHMEHEEFDRKMSETMAPDQIACNNDIKNLFFEQLPEALNSLTDIHKKYIQWNYLEGKSAKEISEMLNVKLNTVEVGIYRAIKNLKKYFANTELAAV